MPISPMKVLALVLCLEQTVMTQEGSLSKPSISAEPGLVIPKGSFVTFVCSNTSGYDIFRLEKGTHGFMVKKNTQPPMTEARFHLGPVNESTAGYFCCLYANGPKWSPCSEILELIVTREDVTQSPHPGSAETSGSTLQSYKVWNSVRMTLAGIILLVLGAFLGEAWHNQQNSIDSLGSMNLGAHN